MFQKKLLSMPGKNLKIAGDNTMSQDILKSSTLISVIIPLYNVGKEYLHDCMESVQNQTYSNIEIILVDDGSEKLYADLYDKYAETDKRVRVLHQKNQGVSMARNNGTQNASGEYLMYVDADDVITPYAISEGVSAIKKENADMVLGGVKSVTDVSCFPVYEFSEKNSYRVCEWQEFDDLREHYLTIEKKEFSEIEKDGYITRAPFARLLKSDIAKAMLFPKNLPVGEDVVWNMRLLSKCKKICIVDNIWYGYIIHGGSAIRKYYGNREEKAREYLTVLWRECEDYCKTHINQFAKSVAVEFYCILNYELLSSKCPFSNKKKKELVRDYLKKWPWNLLLRKEIKNNLPLSYRILFSFCPSGLWVSMLRLLHGGKK